MQEVRVHMALKPPSVDEDLSQQVGDAWLAQGATAIAKVPSALLPESYNLLLHSDASTITVSSCEPLTFDLRLFQ